MIAIRLDKPIDASRLLQSIEQKINEHRKSNTIEDCILCIDIKQISQTVDSLIYKLENTLGQLND